MSVLDGSGRTERKHGHDDIVGRETVEDHVRVVYVESAAAKMPNRADS